MFFHFRHVFSKLKASISIEFCHFRDSFLAGCVLSAARMSLTWLQGWLAALGLHFQWEKNFLEEEEAQWNKKEEGQWGRFYSDFTWNGRDLGS